MTRKKPNRSLDLGHLDGNEQAKLYKRARQLRRAQNTQKRPRERIDLHPQDLEDDESWAPRTASPNSRAHQPSRQSLDQYVELLLNEETASPTEVASARGPSSLVLHIESGRCEVVDKQGVRTVAELSESIRTVQRTALAVGDQVEVEDGRVVSVRPRTTVLSRPDPHNHRLERVIAANVDRVVIVSALTSPPLRPNLIDRYLIAIGKGGAVPIVVVNKVDLAEPNERVGLMSDLEFHRDLGIGIFSVSATTTEGIDELRQTLEGHLSVLVGHSGVGKSSLVNALAPGLDLDTGGVTEHQGKGKHTTTSSTLLELGGGTRIIDTPGVRQFGLTGLRSSELQAYFPEIEQNAAGCRYRDCHHAAEPHCAVRTAAETGAIPERRYRLFLSLREELSPAD